MSVNTARHSKIFVLSYGKMYWLNLWTPGRLKVFLVPEKKLNYPRFTKTWKILDLKTIIKNNRDYYQHISVKMQEKLRNNTKVRIHIHPGWGPRRKVDMSRPRWTHHGGVVRSNLHSLETRKNARKTGHERTKSLMNARKSGHERTKGLMNALKTGERTKVWT